MLYCHVKYRNGYVQTCRMTKKQARQTLNKNADIVQVVVYKNGRICADYIKTIHC